MGWMISRPGKMPQVTALGCSSGALVMFSPCVGQGRWLGSEQAWGQDNHSSPQCLGTQCRGAEAQSSAFGGGQPLLPWSQLSSSDGPSAHVGDALGAG